MTIKTTAFAWLTQAVLFGLMGMFETPGGGSGGGAPAGDPAGGGAPAGDDSAGGSERPSDGGADDGADDPDRRADTGEDDDRYPDHDDAADAQLPEPAVRTRLRATQRFAQRVRPLTDRLRDPATGRFMTPTELDAALTNHREFQTLDRVLKASPRAVQVLLEEQARIERGGEPAGGDGRGEPDAPVAFDEENWPFETETPQGKALLTLAKQNHELTQSHKRLEQQITGVKTGFEQQTTQQIEGQWKNAAFTAANELEAHYRPMFIRAVRREFQLLQSRGQLTRANAKAVIDAELKEVRAVKKSATRTDAADASRRAAGNRDLPRNPRPGTVVPTGGKDPAKPHETIRDASKGFLSKYR